VWNYDTFGYQNIGIEFGKWQHIALTKSNGVVKIYLNGVQKVSKSFGGALTSTSSIMHIGCHSDTTQCTSRYMQGSIDELRISNIARSTDEIYKSYVYTKKTHSGEYVSGILDLQSGFTKVDISSTVSGVSTGYGETPYSTTGLVAQWNFNETSGTVASSGGSCGSACNGTLTNFSNTSGQDKVVSSGWTYNNRRWGSGGLMFDGVDDYVTTSDSSIGDFGTGDFTVETWFRMDSSTNMTYPMILSKHLLSEPRLGYDLTIVNTNDQYKGMVVFELFDGTTTKSVTSKQLIMENKWYHVVATRTGNTLNMYLDGVLDNSVTHESIGDLSNTGVLEIGKLGGGSNNFKGTLDSVRIYNRALTSSEVLSNYNSNAVKYTIRGGNSNNPNDGTWSEWKDNTTKSTLKSFDSPNLYESNEDGLVGYWSMDEESGSTVNDVSGTGNNGTATGTTIIDGKYGKGRSFNGTSDYVTLPSGFKDFTTGMTINLWAKPTVGGTISMEEVPYSTTDLVAQWNFNETNGTVASSGGSCGSTCNGTLTDFSDTSGQDKVVGSGWTYNNRKGGQGALMFDGSNDRVGLTNGTNANITGDISIEFWINLKSSKSHNVIHKDNQYTIQIDSNNAISWADSSNWSYANFGYHNIGIELGKWQHIAVTKSNGIVKIYLNGVEKVSKSFGGALTSTPNIMHIGCYSNSSTCTNYYLNGTLDTVRIYNRAITAAEVLSNYTVNTTFVDLGEQSAQTNTNIMFDRLGETDSLRLMIGNGTELKHIISQDAIINDEWHLYTAIVDTSGVGKIYRDGKLLVEGTLSLPANVNRTSNYIARSNWGRDALYKGNMDEIKIYNKALNANRIQSDYLEGIEKRSTFIHNSSNITADTNDAQLSYKSSRVGTTINDGLVSYWKLDESSGNTVADSVGTNDGTATGTTIIDGKYGKGRSFNGTSDYVTIPHSTSLNLNTFTVSSWFKSTDSGAWFRTIVGKYGNTAIVESWGLGWIDASTLGFYIRDASNVKNQVGAPAEVGLDGNWHHLVGVVSDSIVSFYIDGVLMSSMSRTSGDIRNSREVMFGMNSLQYSLLSMDEVKIYNVAKTSEEIFEEYASLKTIFEKKNTGLVAYWTMDEVSGSTVADSVGTNHGTAIGTTIVDGKINKGRNFNGSSDYISANTDINLANSSFTISQWIKRSTIGGSANQLTFSLGSTGSTNNALFQGFKTNNTFHCGFYSNDLATATQYTDTDWHHWACTYDSNTRKRIIYRDGVKVAEDTAASNFVGNSFLKLGMSSWGTSNYFGGILDETKVYNTTKTSEEIYEEYVSLKTTFEQNNTGLIAHWEMDEESGSTVADSVGTNNGTAIGTSLANGIVNKGRHFNGTSDYIEFSSSYPPTNKGASNTFTVSAWFKTTDTHQIDTESTSGYPGTSGQKYLFYPSQDGTNTDSGMGVSVGINGISIYEHDDSYLPALAVYNGPVPSGEWNHLCVVYNNKQPNIYLNGSLVRVGLTSPKNTVYSPFIIGGGTYGYFQGEVDEVKLYNTAKTPQEIFKEYKSIKQTFDEKKNAGLLAYWNMDEANGSTIADYISINNGTATGTTIVDGRVNKGRNFNGTSDYIAANTNINLANSSFTVSQWIQRNQIGENQFTFSLGSNNTSNNVLHLGFRSTNAFTCAFGSNDLNTSTQYTDTDWHHWACTYDATNRKRIIYRDGVKVGEDTATANYTGNSVLNLGRYVASASSYFRGILDEIKVFNVPLSESEIFAEYTQSTDRNFSPKFTHLNRTFPTTNLSNKISLPVYIASDTVGEHISTTIGESAYANYQPDANTVGLWHLNEIDGNGPYIKDSSGYNNDGIPIGSTYIPDGQIGGARSFDALNDEYVTIKDSPSLNPTAITLEAWIKPSLQERYGNFINKGGNSGYRFRVNIDGTLHFLDRGTTNLLNTTSTVPINKWTYAVATSDSTGTKIYINGVLAASNTTAYGAPVTTTPLYIGKFVEGESFTGLIDEVRISNIARSADEIRQAYEVGLRTHNIEIEFGAMLDNSNLISDSTDTSFTIDGTTKGMRDKGSNIYTGEKIIVREQNSTGEYIAQGIVTSVNKDTGAITVKEWESTSTFPTGGFTTKANVFKWQKEYLPIKGRTLDTHLDQANLLTMRIENGYGGRNIWIDNLTTEEYTPTVSTETINLGDSYRFFQYKAILTSTDANTSPIIQQIQLDYGSDGPTMEQIMRHGKWFNNGEKQPFWWAK
jgi:hypothetical protein